MQTLQFDFCGAHHELTTFDDDDSVATAKDIISGLSYRFPQPGSTFKCVVDLGAHVGEFTIMAAALWPQATIHAFEPNPQVIPLLRQNCQRYANIVIHEQGVRLTPGRGQFFLNSRSSVAAVSFLPEGTIPGVHWTPVEAEYVDPVAITDLLPDVLKIDIEGPEAEFVKAAMPGLERVALIYVEFHGEDRRVEIDRFLLRTHTLYNARISQPLQGDLTYVRRESPLFGAS